MGEKPKLIIFIVVGNRPWGEDAMGESAMGWQKDIW